MVRFEYDPTKSAANRAKHGISLEEAQLLWEGPGVMLPTAWVAEARWMLIGLWQGRCFSCIFTMRGETIRLISARRSRHQEEQLYYEKAQAHD